MTDNEAVRTSDRPDDQPDGHPDGRTARAERTRQSIVDALLSLLEEGDLQPTATRIATRAGISIRLIYHHFGDLESLFRATAIRQAERMRELVEPVARDLPLPERLDAFCSSRAVLLEWITPVRRAALLHEPFSDELSRARDVFIRLAHTEVESLFGHEMQDRPPAERERALLALSALASWNYWDALRTGGNDADEARAVVRLAMGAILGC